MTSGIPSSGVETVVINVTATGSTANGQITAWQAGTTKPSTSNLNFTPGQTIAGLVTVKVNASGQIALESPTNVHLLVDVLGYYATGTASSGSFVPAPSALRVLDTRDASRAGVCDTTCDQLSAGGTLTVDVGGQSGIPDDATAVVVNLQVTGPAAAGHALVYRTGITRPDPGSTLNYAAGQTIGNLAVVRTGTDGKLNIYSFAQTEVLLDVVGWFTTDPEVAYGYTYSGDGLRRTKTAPDGTLTSFTWDRSGGLPMLLAETINEPSTVNDRTVRYVYDPTGLPLADITAPASGGTETLRWYHHDQLGSTRALTDAGGNVIATYGWTPFGQSAGTTGTATTPFGWAGEYKDSETGYVYLRARYYDPATAQFLTRDPLELLTRSAYGYVGNDPTNSIDPSGLMPAGGFLQFASSFGCGWANLLGAGFDWLGNALPSIEQIADVLALISDVSSAAAIAVGVGLLLINPVTAAPTYAALQSLGVGLGLTTVLSGVSEAIAGGLGGDANSREGHIRHGSLATATGMLSGFPYFDGAPKAAVAVGLYLDGMMMALTR